jgi:CTP:molybdopterin cytidylyltransferase MocA
MGSDKALLPWPPARPGTAASAGQTFLSAGVLALRPFTEKVIVVVGKNEERIAPIAYANGAVTVRNPAPERGQFSSLQVGLSEGKARGCAGAIITLVDCPPLSATTLEQLCAAFARARSLGYWGVAPENGGKRGHPLLAGDKLIEAFLTASSSSNAGKIKSANARHIDYLSVTDPSVTLNVNTPEEYAALLPSSRQ